MAAKTKTARTALTAGICTSGSRVKLALLAGGRFRSASKKCLNQEKALFPMLDRLLAPHKARLADLSALCVITGPGRFTGLRVGLTLASALRTLAGIRVWSSTLFEILAAQAAASGEFRAWVSGRKEPRLAALVHAFKNEYFCQVFGVTERRIQNIEHRTQETGRGARSTGYACTALETPRWLKDAELTCYLKSLGTGVYVIADAEEKQEIYALVPEGAVRAPARISKIFPEFIIKTGLALRNRDLAPLYLKPARYELEGRKRIAK